MYNRIWIGFLLMVDLAQAYVLLYNTEISQLFERFNCVYYVKDGEMMPYCHQLGDSKYSSTNYYPNHCFNQGKLLSFPELFDKNVSPTEVLKWSSSVEMADQYSSFYHARHLDSSVSSDIFVCNCTYLGTFGKNCEYQLPFDSVTFEEALNMKFSIRTYHYTIVPHIPSYTQEYGDVVCYTTLDCQSGTLCLDWRDICDRKQQCREGWDEENCDKLEFNECEADEYRCLNGMCIREEYWLDGKLILLEFKENQQTKRFDFEAFPCETENILRILL